MPLRQITRPITLIIFYSAWLSACDSCGCHAPPDPGDVGTTFTVGVLQQFTDFSTVREEGEKVDNSYGQWEFSSITQLVLSANLSNDISFSLFIPYISRSYKRPDENTAGQLFNERGAVSGLGDSSLMAAYRPLDIHRGTDILTTAIIIGIKAPTGNASQLANELPSSSSGDQYTNNYIGGHDLALGSGSWDIPIGLRASGRMDRWYASIQAFYSYRTEGASYYRFANEISASASIGNYLQQDPDNLFGMQANLIGESKGHDWVDGQETPDTANHNIYAGPEIVIILKHQLSGGLAFDLPIYQHDSDYQVVPTWRIRASLNWNFQ